MNFNFNPLVKPLAMAGLIAGLGLSALAQSAATGAPDSRAPSVAAQQDSAQPQGRGAENPDQRMQRRAERVQERADKRLADLKVQLQITPEQESAWTSFAETMKPNPMVRQKMRAARAELQGLTTPERIDRMRALRAERMAAMDQRLDATKAFYAQLNPLQQKAFDQIAAKRMDRAHHGGGRGHHGRADHHRGGDHERGERHDQHHGASSRQS